MAAATAPAWEDITNTDTWDNLPQRDREDLARFYARKVLQPQHGKGSPKVAEFLQQNLRPVPVDQTNILQRAAARLPVAPAFEDAYGAGADSGLTGALMRGKPIDPKALPGGIAEMGRGIADAAQSIDLNPMAPGFGEGLQAAAGSTLGGTLGDPAGMALGLGAGKVAGKVVGLAGKVSPLIGAPIARAAEPVLGGLAGGAALGTAIPLAEHRMPTANDLGPQMLLGGAFGVAGSIRPRAPRPGRVAPEAPPEPGPRPNEPPPGFDPTAGAQEPPRGPGGAGPDAGPQQPPPRWNRDPAAPPPDGAPNEDWRDFYQASQDAHAQQQAETARQQAEAQRQQQAQQQSQQQAGPDPATAGGKTPNPTFDFPKRIAEVQQYIDQHPHLENQFTKALQRSEGAAAKAEQGLLGASKYGQKFIDIARMNNLGQQESAFKSWVAQEPNPAEITRHFTTLKKSIQTAESAKRRLGEMPAELNDWKSIMAKLLRGEEGSASAEGAMGQPLIEAAGKAKNAIHDAIDRAILRHHSRNWTVMNKSGDHPAPPMVPAAPAGARRGSVTPPDPADLDPVQLRAHWDDLRGQMAVAMERTRVGRAHAQAGRLMNRSEPSIQADARSTHLTSNAREARDEYHRLAGEVARVGRQLFGEEDTPKGARRGSFTMPGPDDVVAVAKAAGRVVVSGSSMTRRIVQAINSPIDWVDAQWRDTSLHQKLVDFREAAKYGDKGGPLVNLMRKTFISDYGVPPELLAMADEARLQARNEVTPFRRKALEHQRTLTPNQQAALDYQVTEPAPNGLRSVDAEEIGDESARLSKLLNDVGALGDKAFKRWKGYYLPRVYEDKFPVISSIIREARTLQGSKPRGKAQEMSPKRFAELSQDWTEISNTRGGRRRLVEIENAKGERLLVGLRASGDYLGTWEQRGTTADGKIQAWRDWTLDERNRMGEIRHASLRMHQLANKFERDYARGKLFAEIAKNPKFAEPASKFPPGHEPDGWHLLDNRKNKDGTQKWGKLANHWVDPDTYAYLHWNDEFRRTLALIKTVSGQTLWKRFMTIDNPSYYLNNFMQNVPMLQLAGGSMLDLPAAAAEIMGDTPRYQALVAAGAVQNAPVARELAVDLQRAQVSSAGPLELMLVVSRACKALEAKGANFGAATDDMFRVALAMQKEREGITDPKLQAEAIKGVFYDPSDVTSAGAEALSALAPFAKSFFYTVDRLPQLILDRPLRAMALVGYMAMFTTIMGIASGYDTPEKRKGFEALLPAYMKSDPYTGFPGALPLPGADSFGQQRILDVHNWNPMQAVAGDQKADSPIPSQLQFGGPIFTAANAMGNYDPFLRQTLRDHTPGGIEIKNNTPEYLRNGLLPAIFGLKGGKLIDAIQGRTDAAGRHFDVPTAIGQVLGVKIQPFDNGQALRAVNNHFKAQMAEVSQQIKDLGKRMANNPQDEAKLQAQIDALAQKKAAIGQEWQAVVEVAGQGEQTKTPTPPPGPLASSLPIPAAAQFAPSSWAKGQQTAF